MTDHNKLSDTLLSDPTIKFTQDFGLAYKVDADTMMALRTYGPDLDAATGNNLHLLPVPAAYIVNRDGKIVFSYYNSNIQKRVDPEVLLRAAKMMLSHSH